MSILKPIFGFGKPNRSAVTVDADEFAKLQEHLKTNLAKARHDKKATWPFG